MEQRQRAPEQPHQTDAGLPDLVINKSDLIARAKAMLSEKIEQKMRSTQPREWIILCICGQVNCPGTIRGLSSDELGLPSDAKWSDD